MVNSTQYPQLQIPGFGQIASSPASDSTKNDIKTRASGKKEDEKSMPIFLACKLKLFEQVTFLLTRGAKYSSPGCSLLHLACEDGREEIVKLLLGCRPDLNSRTPDGASAVHLAALFKHKGVLELLLEAGASIDAGVGEKFHRKFFRNYNWCRDFGEEMTLLSHAVVNNNEEMVKLLVDSGADVTRKSLTGKTLLMYAIERDNFKVMKLLLEKMEEEDVNARDDFGMAAVHFILHQNKFNFFRFNPYQALLNSLKALILHELLRKNADVNAMVKNDPETLLINMAAFHGCPEMLKLLLVNQTSKLSQPLFYSSINPHFPLSYSAKDPFFFFASNLKKCTELAVVDILTKSEINLEVSKSEVDLLEAFSLRSDSGDFIAECKAKTRQNLEDLKAEFVRFGENKISIFDILGSGFPVLRKLIRSGDFMEKMRNFECDFRFEYFYALALARLEMAEVRVGLLKDCNKVFVDLRKPFPLPYEIVREIVDFVDNQDLISFIRAFK